MPGPVLISLTSTSGRIPRATGSLAIAPPDHHTLPTTGIGAALSGLFPHDNLTSKQNVLRRVLVHIGLSQSTASTGTTAIGNPPP